MDAENNDGGHILYENLDEFALGSVDSGHGPKDGLMILVRERGDFSERQQQHFMAGRFTLI